MRVRARHHPEQASVPSQRAPRARANDPYFDPEIAVLAREDRRHGRLLKYLPEKTQRNVVDAGGTDLVDFSGEVATANKLTLAIPRNKKRGRFLIINPDDAAETLYFCFDNNPNSLIPIVPGGVWDESGTKIARNAIYVTAATDGHAFGAYEGEPAPDDYHGGGDDGDE